MAADDKPLKPSRSGEAQRRPTGEPAGSAPPDPQAPRARTGEAMMMTVQLPRAADAKTQAAPLQSTVVPPTDAPEMPNLGPPEMPNLGPSEMPTIGPSEMPSSASPGHPLAMPADWRYTVNSEIARGGMGRVVDATDNVLGRTVALKEALSLDADTLRRFQRETRITARLEHPSIVPVHDAGTAPNGSPFYVMRKVSGRPLEELVARSGALNDRLALVPHIVAAAHAIAHAHSRGIVHRDIKPSNILAGDAGETIVIDWGLAKTIGEPDDPHAPAQRVLEDDDSLRTRAGVVFGTPGFMAPEQLRGKPVDERCDVYALGATLYHCLARRPPHYHKDPDEMMKGAVDGPPQPLREIVEGVPPELATIVDKALAHESEERYQNAGALAEDLQRFLTGQLVASHYYTPRERLVRFVRKYRAAVAIAVASAFVLGVVAFVLIQQIRDERDRADEQARIAVAEKKLAEQETKRAVKTARELALVNARHAATVDPTRAAAMAKPLVDSELWRHARDVGGAASVHGVAFALKASPHTQSLELSRDGQRALVAGDDGLVRIYELAKRESRVIADMKGAVMAHYADGERKLVLFQGNRLTIVDTASGARRDVTAPTAITKLEVSGPIAYWVDPAFAVWRLDLAAGTPTRVTVPEPITSVSPSPDGRWIALAGRQHLLLLDRTSSTLPAEVVTDGEAIALTWAANSAHLVALFDDEIIDISMAPTVHIFSRMLVGRRFSIAYSAGRIFSAGPSGVEMMMKDGTRMRAPGPEHTLGVFASRERVVISAKPQGEIVVLSDLGDHVLKSPLPLAMIATSANSEWIVGAADDRLLVWNLDNIEPQVATNATASSARFVTGDHLIVTYEDGADWIDLRTHKSISLGSLRAIDSVATAPDGAEAIIIDAQRRALRVAGVGKPQELEGEVAAAAFIDNLRLVLAVPGGLRLDDQQHKTKLLLYSHDAEVRGLAAAGGWIVAAFADGMIWRKHVASSQTSELRIAPIASRTPIAITETGMVVVAANGELRAWANDGNATLLAKNVPPLSSLAITDAATAVLVGDDGSIAVADLKRPTPLGAPLTAIKGASLATEEGLVAAATASGGVEVIDPLTGWRWPIAAPQKAQPYSFVEIAPDGSRVVAMTPSAVFVWTLALPTSADQTKRWLNVMTNAVADTPSGPLGWD